MAALATPRNLYLAVGGDPAGELAFAPHVHDDLPPEEARRKLRAQFPRFDGSANQPDVGRTVDIASDLLDRLMAGVEWGALDLVGFSLTFQQTNASAALARRLKAAFPQLKIVIGGACCEGGMGQALLEEFPWFDYAISGRAEHIIIPAVDAMLSGARLAAVPGLCWRPDAGGVVANAPKAVDVALDDLPVPDYDDYFTTRRALGLGHSGARLLLETSVGCWWGEKHLCTFCGLNATSLAYRQKSGARVLAEIEELGERYRVSTFELVDNILPLDYFETLLPALAQRAHPLSFFAEVKTNLTKAQLALLRDAGFRFLQPGIESFDDHILTLMDKGCTGIGQVQYVKWCDELGIGSAYSMLVRNPGEVVEDYERMTEWIPSLVHLTPPFGDPGEIQLARFSPYFDHPERHGTTARRPQAIFAEVFPRTPPERLARMVFMFEFDHPGLDAPGLAAARGRFARAVRRWRAVHQPALLTYRRGNDWLRITDVRESIWLGRKPSVSRTLLRGPQAEIYASMDRARRREDVRQAFRHLEATKVDAFIDRLVAQRLVLDDGKKVLALAIDSSELQVPRSRHEAVAADDPGWAQVLPQMTWEALMTPPAQRRSRRRLALATG